MTAFGLIKLSFALFCAVGFAAVTASLLFRKKLGLTAKIFAFGIAAGSFFFIYIFHIEPNWIQVHHVKIKDAALAEVVGDTKIVHITDIHLHEGIGPRERKLVKKVNALKPDILFFTGDIIDNLTQLKPALELFSQFKAKQIFLGVPGNTDHIVMDGRSLERSLEPSGIDILVNESFPVRLANGNTLWVVGVDDPKYRHADLNQAMANVPQAAPVILLAHEPRVFDEAVEYGVNLALIGDTHGGQVGIPLLIKMSDYANRTPYISGFYQKGNTKMYVNRGIGMKTLYLRFLCRPEIAVIEIQK